MVWSDIEPSLWLLVDTMWGGEAFQHWWGDLWIFLLGPLERREMLVVDQNTKPHLQRALPVQVLTNALFSLYFLPLCWQLWVGCLYFNR